MSKYAPSPAISAPAPLAAKSSAVTLKWNGVENYRQLRHFLFVAFGLALCFSKPLFDLARFAARDELYSHILIVPFVSLYLIWNRRQSLASRLAPPTSGFWHDRAWIPLSIGGSILGIYWLSVRAGWPARPNDYLSCHIFAFVLLFTGVCFLFLNSPALRTVAFPLAFLMFLVPLPAFMRNWIEVFFQNASADAAYLMLNMSGTAVIRHGLEMRVPGLTFMVGQECSGIHSSLVLFITSLLAGHLLLRSPWKKAVLVLAVIPLGILRNGFRIFIIAQLCVHIGPDMIHSVIHRRGGPIFFALSLLPLFLLVWLLLRSEAAQRGVMNSAGEVGTGVPSPRLPLEQKRF